MNRWEYKTVVLALALNLFDEELNRLGQDGWRMVGSDTIGSETINQQRRFIFMRPATRRPEPVEESSFEEDDPEPDVREAAGEYLRGPFGLKSKR